MNKIDQTIEFIRQFISGQDQSDTPAMRKALEIYGRACSEVNKDLQHCRKLIDRGLRMDAQKYAQSMQPSLTARAGKLMLTANVTNRLLELCDLYHYPKPEVLDRKTLTELGSNAAGNDDNLQELIRRWRQTARVGSSFEKIRILRSILAAGPADCQIWKNNLLAVEKYFLKELYAEAHTALQSGDEAKLCDLYQAMSSPELLSEPDLQQLKKFQPAVKAYQQKQLSRELKNKLNELYRQYNLQNQTAAAQLMREYDDLCTHPLYQPDKIDEQTVSEIRRYLEECAKQQKIKQEFERLKQELYAAIEQRIDFPEIENIYSILRRTGLPVEETLDQRIRLLRQDYVNERNRTHIRKCFYGTLAAILLGGIAVCVFLILQTSRSSSSYGETMEKLITSGNYQAVQELYKQIEQENPMVLKFGRVKGLYLEAMRLQEARDARIKNLSSLAASCRRELSRPAPEIGKLQYLVKQIDSIPSQDLSGDIAIELQKIRFELHGLESARQQQQEKKFLNACQQLHTQLDQVTRLLELPDAKLDDLALKMKKIDQSAGILFSSSGIINKELFQSSRTLYKNRRREASDKYTEIIKNKKLHAVLTTPDTVDIYLETLAKLPIEAPLLAAGAWRSAVAALPQNGMLIKISGLPANYKHIGELSEVLNQQSIDMNNNPVITDLMLMLPSEYSADQIKTFTNRLSADYSALYNCRELVLRSNKNQRCRFYTTEEPVIETSRTSHIPKAIGVKVMLLPGTEGKFTVFRLVKNNHRTVIYPGKIEGLKIPGYFIGVENIAMTNMVLPEAEHSVFLKSLLFNLASTANRDELEDIVIKNLKKLQQAQSMNIFARAALTGELLKILPAIAPLYGTMAAAASRQLAAAAGNHLAKWYEPDAEIKYPDQFAALTEFFKQLDVELMQKRCRFIRQLYLLCFERGVIPGGIVSKVNKKSFAIHSFQGLSNPSEIWFYQAGDAQTPGAWLAIDGKPSADGTWALPEGVNAVRGTLFFCPLDGRNTAELAAGIVKAAEKLGITQIPWPHSWPVNCR